LGVPIQSVYPPRNGIDTSVGVLNTKFQPVSLKSKDAILGGQVQVMDLAKLGSQTILFL